MKSKFKIYGIYMIAYLLLLPALVTLGAIACMNHLGDDGYFTVTTIADIAGVGVAAASVFLLSYVFWASKKIKLIPSFTSPLNYGPCAVMSAALIFIAAHLVVKAGVLKGTVDGFTLVLGLLALLSVLYFVISSISVKRRSIMRSDLGIIVLVFLCAYVAYIFFDKSTPINAPVKTATMMAFLFFSLFFLYETRLSLGREKWHLYVAFAFISSIISAYASIPALIVYIIKGDVIGISIYETVLVFAFFIFSTFKLFLVGELVPERGSNVVNKLIASATERIHELKPAEPAEEKIEELDENQFSILGTDAENEESQGSAEEAESDTEEVLADNGENTVDEGILTVSDGENVTNSDERMAENATNAENADEISPEGAVCDTTAIPEDKGNTTPINTTDEEINTRVEFSDEKDIKEE